MAVRVEPGFFSYDHGADELHWHVNFAASDLFYAYGSALLAQDELQVLEHPALASVREALGAERRSTLTVEEGRPTPILVTGVERRGRLDTAPCAARPHGLYGNAFAASPVPEMLAALEPLVPPGISNVIAIEAPPGGSGRYGEAELAFILATAYGGFRAAVLEGRALAPGLRVVVHTGWWGCGAYGGNRMVMGLLQLEAAALVGVARLVFHAGDASGERDIERVLDEYLETGSAGQVDKFIGAVAARGYRWGVGNGT